MRKSISSPPPASTIGGPVQFEATMSAEWTPLRAHDWADLDRRLNEADALVRSRLPRLSLTGEAADRFVLQVLLNQGGLDWDDPAEIEPIELAVGRLLILMEGKTKNPRLSSGALSTMGHAEISQSNTATTRRSSIRSNFWPNAWKMASGSN